MSIVTQLAPMPPMTGAMMQLTVDRYLRMIETGILTDEDHVELLEGWVMLKMPRNAPHDNAIERSRRRMEAVLVAPWLARSPTGIRLSDSVPEPDLTVAVGPLELYDLRHPRPDEIGMVVEVADSTLSRDRGEKVRIYARAAIPIYWIINVNDHQVEVYTAPDSNATPPTYRQRQDFALGSSVPVVLRGQQIGSIPVQDLFP